VKVLEIDPADQDYAPIAGLGELRAAVADLYNRLYRRGMKSQYTAENVSISSGGRAALTRVAASIGHVNLGHFLPDYTAYEELLEIFRAFTAIPILLEGDRKYAFTADDLRREVRGREHWLSVQPDGLTSARQWIDEQADFWSSRADALSERLRKKGRVR